LRQTIFDASVGRDRAEVLFGADRFEIFAHVIKQLCESDGDARSCFDQVADPPRVVFRSLPRPQGCSPSIVAFGTFNSLIYINIC
jgi:hypothetical protein